MEIEYIRLNEHKKSIFIYKPNLPKSLLESYNSNPASQRPIFHVASQHSPLDNLFQIKKTNTNFSFLHKSINANGSHWSQCVYFLINLKSFQHDKLLTNWYMFIRVIILNLVEFTTCKLERYTEIVFCTRFVAACINRWFFGVVHSS